jgi:hypothetical protein
MLARGSQAVLGELPLRHAHAALGAGLPPTADGLDANAEGAGGVKQGRACLNEALPPGGLEYDPVLLSQSAASCFFVLLAFRRWSVHSRL